MATQGHTECSLEELAKGGVRNSQLDGSLHVLIPLGLQAPGQVQDRDTKDRDQQDQVTFFPGGWGLMATGRAGGFKGRQAQSASKLRLQPGRCAVCGNSVQGNQLASSPVLKRILTVRRKTQPP
jgi:hypothetical protein